jgi:magnesium-transporting ATPase (P-type)
MSTLAERPARGPDPEESVDALLRDLSTGLDGLGTREPERRLRQYGLNEIRRLERAGRVRRARAPARRPALAAASPPPRPPGTRLIDRAILTRAYLWLGLVEAVLVTAGFFWVLTRGGWSWGEPTGEGSPLHHAYITATTMTFAGIVACQVGAGLATRTTRASLRQIGLLTNRLLLYGIAFEVAFAAALVYLPPLQPIFHTAPLSAAEVAVLATFAVIVWASDELRRRRMRRRSVAQHQFQPAQQR